jgi:hypothetical protein
LGIFALVTLDELDEEPHIDDDRHELKNVDVGGIRVSRVCWSFLVCQKETAVFHVGTIQTPHELENHAVTA